VSGEGGRMRRLREKKVVVSRILVILLMEKK
jgi:hypothetical protein